MPADKHYSLLERFLRLGADVHPGEGGRIFSLCYMLFMLMLTAYLMKPVREELILIENGSEVKSYATALQAIVLLLLVPVYGRLSRRFPARGFMLGVTGFCTLMFILFIVMGSTGVPVAVPFYVWFGSYGLMVASQFWAYTSDFYTEDDGKRLFGLIAFGAAAGALAGSLLSKLIPKEVDPYLMLSCGVLVLTLAMVPVVFERNPRMLNKPKAAPGLSWLDAFRLVLNNRYLLVIAIFTLLFNWLNSLGEYLVSVVVEYYYQQDLQAGLMAVSENAYIRSFYSDYYLLVNTLGMLVQFFAVSRMIQYLGVRITIFLVPVFIFLGYSLVLVFPVVLFFKVIKVIENSLDYSLLGTIRQLLYSPADRQARYEGRAVIETLCVRLGDLLQGLTVFVAISLLMLEPVMILWVVIALAASVILACVHVVRRYENYSRNPDEGDANAENAAGTVQR